MERDQKAGISLPLWDMFRTMSFCSVLPSTYTFPMPTCSARAPDLSQQPVVKLTTISGNLKGKKSLHKGKQLLMLIPRERDKEFYCRTQSILICSHIFHRSGRASGYSLTAKYMPCTHDSWICKNKQTNRRTDTQSKISIDKDNCPATKK